MEPIATINLPGEILADAGYTRPESKRRWLLNEAIRKAKRKGLAAFACIRFQRFSEWNGERASASERG